VTIGIAPPPSLNRRDHLDRPHRWSRDEKRIVAESAQAGRTASQVARDHGIAPGQLFLWRRQLLAEAVANGAAADGFVSVTIASEPETAASSGAVASSDAPAIEIRFPNGIVIVVSNAVEVEALRCVLAVVSGRCWCRRSSSAG
jgi:transposase-like protein